MIGQSLLLLKGQKSCDLFGATQLTKKIDSSCNESYKIEYKITVMVICLAL